MKKCVSALCALALLLSLSACGTQPEPAPSEQQTPASSQAQPAPSASEGTSSAPEEDAFEGLKEIENQDWLYTQPAVEEQIQKESAGGYTPDKPLVVVDPYKKAPLTALVIFDAPQECTVTVTIPGKDDATTFTHAFTESGAHHEIPVYGLYAGQENPVRLALQNADGTTGEYTVPITTEPLPDYLAPFTIPVNEKELTAGELLYVGMATNTLHPFAIDKNGDVRWYSPSAEFNGGISRRMDDGRLLTFAEPLYAPAWYRPGVDVSDRMGKVYRQYQADLSNHDFRQLPNGNILINTLRPGSEVMEGPMVLGCDLLLEMDAKTGEVLNKWDINEICGYSEADIAAGKTLHNNAVWYNEADDSFIISSPSAMVVVKFGASTREVIWAIGDPRHGYSDKVQEKILTPVGEGFDWNGAQHAPMVLPNGNILMDDNGAGRLDADGNPVPDAQNYSRLVEYKIDEQAMTIEQVFQYGKERGNDLFATYLGDADYLGENHYLLNAGGRIVGDDGVAQGTAFDAYMGIKNAEAKIVELLDGQVIFEMLVGGKGTKGFNNVYRVEKQSVYAENEPEYNLAQDKAERFGTLLPSEPVDFQLPEQYGELEVQCTPVNNGYQLNVPAIAPGMGQKDVLYMELRAQDGTRRYFPTAGLGGAQGIVRAKGLKPGAYALGFALAKEDGSVAYAPTEYKWTVLEEYV